MVEVLNNILKDCHAKVHAATLTSGPVSKVDESKDVLARAKEFYEKNAATCTGWLCFTDQVQIVPDDFCFANGKNRILLCGELVQGLVSLHIRQSDTGWMVFELTRTDGGEMLMVEESFLSIRQGGTKLYYENYWHKVKNGEVPETYQPFAARFAGFEQEGK